MNFEYNGHLIENERIKLVADEIITKYPQISAEKAKKVAMLEGRISNKKTYQDELNRLYNIMLINSNDKILVSIVLNDFITTINTSNIRENDFYLYKDLTEGIKSFLEGNIDFPFIEDYK